MAGMDPWSTGALTRSMMRNLKFAGKITLRSKLGPTKFDFFTFRPFCVAWMGPWSTGALTSSMIRHLKSSDGTTSRSELLSHNWIFLF